MRRVRVQTHPRVKKRREIGSIIIFNKMNESSNNIYL